jgi:hypothetical protein
MILTAVFFAGHGPAEAGIPRQGSVAVVVGGVDEMHALAAQAIFLRELINNGYSVVDESTLNVMRRSEEGRFALQGNVEAIKRLSSRYGIGTFVTAYIRAGWPERNEFRLYTGTASIAVQASTGANMIYADTASAKQVGYTFSEATQKSIEAAAIIAAQKLTR